MGAQCVKKHIHMHMYACMYNEYAINYDSNYYYCCLGLSKCNKSVCIADTWVKIA